MHLFKYQQHLTQIYKRNLDEDIIALSLKHTGSLVQAPFLVKYVYRTPYLLFVYIETLAKVK